MEAQYLFENKKLNDQEKDYIEKKITKVNKLLGKYDKNEIKVNVEIDQDRRMFWEITVTLSVPKKQFRVKKKDSDLFKAVDLVEEALMKQVRRENEKERDTTRNRDRKGEQI